MRTRNRTHVVFELAPSARVRNLLSCSITIAALGSGFAAATVSFHEAGQSMSPSASEQPSDMVAPIPTISAYRTLPTPQSALITIRQSGSALAQKTRREQAGMHGSLTYADPTAANHEGPQVSPFQWVEVSCRMYAPELPGATPDGWWYRIISPPWLGFYFAPANNFWNGDKIGVLPYTRNTDFTIPVC
jgi:hypothetical protein